MFAFLDSVPAGRVILVAVCDDAGICDQMKAYFQKLGSTRIGEYGFRDSWAFITRKGSGRATDEAFGKNGASVTAKVTIKVKK